MGLEKYIHRVKYYETDKMGVTHHSNYVRWMEEARIDFLEQIGFGYRKLEDDGIVSPVIGVECEFKATTTFDDTVEIEVGVEEFRGVRLVIFYKMVNAADGKLVLTGRTRHCFVDANGRPTVLEHSFPDFAHKLAEMQEISKSGQA
ncbi:MAG: acyl-CoA thioesterase [Bacteroidaceae bacterium]|nr:acyl-CoA thioesterase [Bacteroidaceae bacterium]